VLELAPVIGVSRASARHGPELVGPQPQGWAGLRRRFGRALRLDLAGFGKDVESGLLPIGFIHRLDIGG
jgi:hypothetical protein